MEARHQYEAYPQYTEPDLTFGPPLFRTTGPDTRSSLLHSSSGTLEEGGPNTDVVLFGELLGVDEVILLEFLLLRLLPAEELLGDEQLRL